MPLYEYRCDACGHCFEEIQRFSDPLIQKCPSCGAAAVHKLLSPPAIQFKGTGWYITDYAKKPQPAARTDQGEPRQESKEAGEPTGASDSKGTAPAKDVRSEKGSTTAAAAPGTKAGGSRGTAETTPGKD